MSPAYCCTHPFQCGHHDPACAVAQLASHSSASAGVVCRPSRCRIYSACRRIDDARHMPGGGEGKRHRPAENLRRRIGRAPRRNMVFLGGEEIGRRFDCGADRSPRPAYDNAARIFHDIFEIAFAQDKNYAPPPACWWNRRSSRADQRETARAPTNNY